MGSLKDNILSIERQADEIVAAARAEAQAIEKQTLAEMDAARATAENETAGRIEAYRQDAETRHREALAESERELGEALGALDKLDTQIVEKQASAVVARFREL